MRKDKGWTVETLRIHMAEMREERLRFEAERDLRYKEVAVEREKALKIKEEADTRALALASEIQKYKDEKANELRSQINSERGLYATHAELGSAIEKVAGEARPAIDYEKAQKVSRPLTATMVASAAGFVLVLLGIAAWIGAHFKP